MARYKPIDTQPTLMPVDLAAHLFPGTFAHALPYLLEHAIDLTPFDARYRNDTIGAPAYPPAIWLRIDLVRLRLRDRGQPRDRSGRR